MDFDALSEWLLSARLRLYHEELQQNNNNTNNNRTGDEDEETEIERRSADREPTKDSPELFSGLTFDPSGLQQALSKALSPVHQNTDGMTMTGTPTDREKEKEKEEVE